MWGFRLHQSYDREGLDMDSVEQVVSGSGKVVHSGSTVVETWEAKSL
jgi:hypothetical protein